MPLNCTLRNSENGQFYVCLTVIKKKKKKLMLLALEPERSGVSSLGFAPWICLVPGRRTDLFGVTVSGVSQAQQFSF